MITTHSDESSLPKPSCPKLGTRTRVKTSSFPEIFGYIPNDDLQPDFKIVIRKIDLVTTGLPEYVSKQLFDLCCLSPENALTIVNFLLAQKTEINISDTYKLNMISTLLLLSSFTEWGEAISRVMGYDDMSFVNAFHENRSKQNMIAVEESLVGSLLVIFWNDYKKEQNKESQNEKPKFDGSPAELYSQLVDSAQSNDININNRQFPKTPAALIKKLNIIKPNLKEALNIVIEVSRDENNNSVITIYESVIHTVSNPD